MPSHHTLSTRRRLCAAALGLLAATMATARVWAQGDLLDEADGPRTRAAPALPEKTLLLRDQAYGADRRQRADVYLPPRAAGAPILVLVHGGGWRHGDKTSERLMDHKLAHWLPLGVVVVSVNYRMLPQAQVHEQAQDLAQALTWVQSQAAAWGGDASRVVLMGHSAGAHLAALVGGQSGALRAAGPRAPLALVLLDSGALDVPALMAERHARLFDQAFGSDPAYWARVSPQQQLRPDAPPVLAVCSSLRRTSCTHARAYVDALRAQGGQAELLVQALTHGQVNEQLGQRGGYTDAVDAFLARQVAWPRR